MRRAILTGLCLICISLFSAGLLAANTIPAPPAGNLRYSITVTKFKNEAGWGGRWNVGDGMQTVMTNLLQKSGWFIVLGDG